MSEELRVVLINNFKSGTKKGGYSWDLLQVNKAQAEIEALLKSEQTKLLDKLLEKMPEEFTGWTNFGKNDLTETEEGYNATLSDVKSIIEELRGQL